MNDRPIIFSAPMVRALLEGRKTMTRRMPWAWLRFNFGDSTRWPMFTEALWGSAMHERSPFRTLDLGCGQIMFSWSSAGLPHQQGARTIWMAQPIVQPGDRLWVRENYLRLDPEHVFGSREHVYGADCPAGSDSDAIRQSYGYKWKVARYMPRAASRITLTVEAIKIEPLLDISEADARAEGFAEGKLDDGFGPRDFGGGCTIESPGTWASAAGMFQVEWAKLHPAWDGFSSPEVVALTFRVEQRNIDAAEAAT